MSFLGLVHDVSPEHFETRDMQLEILDRTEDEKHKISMNVILDLKLKTTL